MKVQSERIRWIDIAKGIGILLVICGHSTNGGGSYGDNIFFSYTPFLYAFGNDSTKYTE